MAVSNKTTKSVPAYGKDALLNSEIFNSADRIILNLELEDGKDYTIAQAQKVIKDFKGGI